MTNSPLPVRERVVELGQVLGRHGEVGVEDHQHVVRRGGEALAHGVALALAGLVMTLMSRFGVGGRNALDLLKVPSWLWPSTKITLGPLGKAPACAYWLTRYFHARCGPG